VALQKARLRDNLQVHIDVPEPLRDLHVAPLSVQLLIENALKHNEASRLNPLHVRVRVTADWLTVQNARRTRTGGLAPGTGMGLRNIRERYALLAPQRPVQVADEAATFTVHLPLLPAAVEEPAVASA
jgi:LytS/YehU family sensor histidine kinase